jgi:hypothetical protein
MNVVGAVEAVALVGEQTQPAYEVTRGSSARNCCETIPPRTP